MAGTWAAISRHLGLSERQLRALRSARSPFERLDIPVEVEGGQSAVIRLVLDPLPISGGASMESSESATASAAILMSSTSGGFAGAVGRFATGERNGVFVALGVPSLTTPQRFDREARTITTALRGRRLPEIQSRATLAELQGLAIRQPFVLHVAAHRDLGAVMLSDPSGNGVPVLDEDLIPLIAPEEGAPAVIVLSFCDSHQVAKRLRDRDIALISFEGELSDSAAFSFCEHLYEALALGRTVSMSFEVGKAAVRGAHGVEPLLSPFSSAHGRNLPL